MKTTTYQSKRCESFTFVFSLSLDNDWFIGIDLIWQLVNQSLYQLRTVGGKNCHVISRFVLQLFAILCLKLYGNGGSTTPRTEKQMTLRYSSSSFSPKQECEKKLTKYKEALCCVLYINLCIESFGWFAKRYTFLFALISENPRQSIRQSIVVSIQSTVWKKNGNTVVSRQSSRNFRCYL